MICDRFDRITASCAPCCGVCGLRGTCTTDKENAAPDAANIESGGVEQVLTASASASIINENREDCKR